MTQVLVPNWKEVPATGALNKVGRRIPSLDGLRAISILLVFVAHATGTRGFFSTAALVPLGTAGVQVFFIISGFLITTLLVSEWQSHGRISLPLFYARRSIRIFPASYAFIVAVSLFSLAGSLRLATADIWRAVTYTTNFWPGHSWYFGHLWSLSVEEQFYLVWPFLFALSAPRRIHWAAIGLISIAVSFRLLDDLILSRAGLSEIVSCWFVRRADGLAMGCLLAIIGPRLLRKQWYVRMFHPIGSFAVLASVLPLGYFERHVAFGGGFAVVATNAGVAFLIHRCVHRPDDILGLILNSRLFCFIGILSYSLYLWQQPFLNRESHSWFCAFPQNILLALAAALMSYYFVEKPFLNLRRRLRARSTA
jgi:peptidoglycan/LPS O-acetylase OafA/YrhL